MSRSGLSALPLGVIASSVTPFGSDGKPELARVQAHIDWLIGEGVAGLSPLGSAGEFFVMESADRKRVLERTLEANGSRVPVLAGTHHYSTAITIDLSQHAEKSGADALLIVPPYYARPTLDQVMDHYRRIADAVSIPIVLYHNASSTSVDLQSEHLLKLHEEGAIAGVKMSNLLPDRMVQLLQVENPMRVYAGIDYVAFEGLAHGAHGWISALPSMTPRYAVALYKTIAERGDLPEARRQWRKLAPLMRFVFQDSHIAHGTGAGHWSSIMKATLNLIGPDIGWPQSPGGDLDAASTARLRAMLIDLGYVVK